MSKAQALQGNTIVSKAALAAGCDFYAGYPISPSSEITGIHVQGDAEAGTGVYSDGGRDRFIGCMYRGFVGWDARSMTATSGPGFSLMQENLGMAVMAEVPLVIVDSMRGRSLHGASNQTFSGRS